ncbi:MAG TPA: hypothetical protein VNT75_22165, partial [Symbiobacteriaceae bacterium]|nr:hypothetical protein [Symbiobacteriaceae bacterium]
TSGPAGCCLDADSRKLGESVTIRGGITAHLLNIDPPILWWNENGAYVALEGPHQTRESLIRIAESLSDTAE